MSDNDSDDYDYLNPRLVFISVDEPGLKLPADAPSVNPQILDVSNLIDRMFESSQLKLIDTVATTLCKWNPEALKNMLNMSKGEVHWGHFNRHGIESYVTREKDWIHVSSFSKFPADLY
jgi:hypothetical protein